MEMVNVADALAEKVVVAATEAAASLVVDSLEAAGSQAAETSPVAEAVSNKNSLSR